MRCSTVFLTTKRRTITSRVWPENAEGVVRMIVCLCLCLCVQCVCVSPRVDAPHPACAHDRLLAFRRQGTTTGPSQIQPRCDVTRGDIQHRARVKVTSAGMYKLSLSR